MAFDFKKNLIRVQGGRTYLPVAARLVWFREEHPDWGIETESVALDLEKQYAIFRARIYNAEGKLMATGTKMENVKGFPDYLEKSETGAIGRALALCGYGTQFEQSLEDPGSGGRFADSPQGGPRGNYTPNGGGNFGNSRNDDSGGSRFTPPREVSAPRDGGSAPPARPESSRPEPARPEPVRPANAAPSRPAPVSPPVGEEDEDDFEALVGGDMLSATEDDPFGDEDEAPAPAPAKPAASAAKIEDAPAKSDGPPACVVCGKALTKAQENLSIRNYGEALCPEHQRTRTRQPAAA